MKWRKMPEATRTEMEDVVAWETANPEAIYQHQIHSGGSLVDGDGDLKGFVINGWTGKTAAWFRQHYKLGVLAPVYIYRMSQHDFGSISPIHSTPLPLP